MISLTTTTTRKDDDFSSSSFADRRHHRDARYGREKKRTGRTRWRRKRTRASEGTRRVFIMNREKTTRLIERLDNMTKIQREGTPLNDERFWERRQNRTTDDLATSKLLWQSLLHAARRRERREGRLVAFCCSCLLVVLVRYICVVVLISTSDLKSAFVDDGWIQAQQLHVLVSDQRLLEVRSGQIRPFVTHAS